MRREELIDQIYECCFVGENWRGLLDQLARYSGAMGGFLFSFDPSVGILRSVTLAPQHGARVRIESIDARPEPVIESAPLAAA